MLRGHDRDDQRLVKTRITVRTDTDALVRSLTAARRTLKPRSLPATVEQKPQTKDSKDNRANPGLESGDSQNKTDHAETLKSASDTRNARRAFNARFDW